MDGQGKARPGNLLEKTKENLWQERNWSRLLEERNCTTESGNPSVRGARRLKTNPEEEVGSR